MTLLAIITVVISALYLIFTYMKLKGLLELNHLRRTALLSYFTIQQLSPKPPKYITITFATITFVLLIASWGVYISLGIIAAGN